MEDKWTIVDGELYHHGILGQKWGHRNGPPYPLDASDYSKAERQANASTAKTNFFSKDNARNGSYEIKTERKKSNDSSFNKVSINKYGKADPKVDELWSDKSNQKAYATGKTFWKKYRESKEDSLKYLSEELKDYGNFELILYEDDNPKDSEFNIQILGKDNKMVIYGDDHGTDYYFLPKNSADNSKKPLSAGAKAAIATGAVVTAGVLATYGVRKMKQMEPKSEQKPDRFNEVMSKMKKIESINSIDNHTIASYAARKVSENVSSPQEGISNNLKSKYKTFEELAADFNWGARLQRKANGETVHGGFFPDDVNRYAVEYAKFMCKGSQKEYDYWYNYIKSKL